jgi:hypothetical protein
MSKIGFLIVKICLGIFAATNFAACIVTTEARVLIPLNCVVAVICCGIFLFMESKVAGLARDLGITRAAARKLVGDYFDYYKNVERVSIDEYLEKRPVDGRAGTGR